MMPNCEIKSLVELEKSGILELGRGIIINKKDLAGTPGDFPVYSSAQLNNGIFGRYGKYKFDEELITWSVDGGGTLFHRPKHKFSITNVGGYCRILSTDIINYKYLYFILSHLHSTINFDWVKKAHPSTLRKEYKSIPLPILSEQIRIASTINKAFLAIDKVKANNNQNLQNVQELFENTLQILFDNKEWEYKKLGEIASFKNGMNFTKSSKGQSIEIVGVKNFKNKFWVPFDELEKVILDGEMSEAYQLKKGDIITVRSNGNPKLIGRTLLADDVNGNISHSGFTIRIRLNPNTLFPVFLCHYLKTSKTRKELVESGNGVGIKSLNQGSLSSLMVPYPKSEEQQKLIVNKIEEISKQTKKLEAIYTQKISDLEEMKKSILQKAYSGQLNTIN